MPKLARPPHARLTARVTLITALGAVSCMPLQDLDEYRKPAGAAGAAPQANATQVPGTGEAPANVPPVNAGSAGTGASETPIVPSGPLSGVAGASSDGELGGPTKGDPEALEQIDGGAADAAAVGPCLAGEQLGPNARCYRVEATLATWSAAREACQARGQNWDLASVRSAEDAAFLGAAITSEVWIAASD